MIFAGFSILKFLGGFNIFNGEKLGKLLFYLILIAAALGVYSKIVQPTQKTIVQEQKIEHYYNAPCEQKALVEFRLWRIFKIGLGGR